MPAGMQGRGSGPNHDSVLKGSTTQAGQGVWACWLGLDDCGQLVCECDTTILII